MIRLPVLVVCVVVAAAALIGAGRANADTPTPSPSAAPATVPSHSAKISIHSLLRGLPLLNAGLPQTDFTGATVNGQYCGQTAFDALTQIGPVFPLSWPWNSDAPCNEVGVPVKICSFLQVDCTEEFTFDGHDASVDLNWTDLGVRTLTLHFVHDDVPAPLTLTAWSMSTKRADGRQLMCAVGGAQDLHLADGILSFWGCSGEISASFDTAEFGKLTETFSVADSRADIEQDVIIPSAETPSPEVTASPASTATAAALPQAGGPPADADGALGLLAAGLAAMAAGAGGWLIARRRPLPAE